MTYNIGPFTSLPYFLGEMYNPYNIMPTSSWYTKPFYNTVHNEDLFPSYVRPHARCIGTSVIAVKFNKGVIIAADLVVSRNMFAQFRDCPRIVKLNENIIVGGSGDYADFQYMTDMMKRKITDEQLLDDDMNITPKSMHCWLTRVSYTRRSKCDPLMTNFVVAGVQDDQPFLGAVDIIGTAYEDACISTGLGTYLSIPLLRECTEGAKKLNENKAKDLVVKCLRTMFYRDPKAYQKYLLGTITKDYCEIEGPLELDHDWSVARMIKGYK